MPGTAGSLLAALPLLALPAGVPGRAATGAGVLVFTALSVHLARRARFPGGSQDPPWFVMDEAAGMWAAALACNQFRWEELLSAFALFRIFDIAKPWPIRSLERAGAGFGIVLDDLVAGGYALGIFIAIQRLDLVPWLAL